MDELLKREDGSGNPPDSRGGASEFGITKAVERAHGYASAMRDLPSDDATPIPRSYWFRARSDAVALRTEGVSGELFDTEVNMGPGVEANFFKRALTALNRNNRDYDPHTFSRSLP